MKKLRNKKGFTLTEMLIAVLLLGFVSVLVTVMTSAVLSTTHMMQEVAQAEILGNEALANLQEEIRFGQNIKVADGNISFTRQSTGWSGCKFDLDEKGMIVVKYMKKKDEGSTGGSTGGPTEGSTGGSTEGSTGGSTEGSTEGSTTQTERSELLFSGTSYGNLRISEMKFELSEDKRVDISLAISYGDKEIWTGNISVKPINGIPETS